MEPLHPAYVWILRIRLAAAAAAALLAAMIWGITIVSRATGLSPMLLATFAAALLVAIVWCLPPRHYRSWGFRQNEDELVVKHGRLIRRVTVVPFGRVQHIDIAHGPLERMFGLSTLVLNTAGSRGASVHLPGLAHDRAETMRDHIRGKIRQDLG